MNPSGPRTVGVKVKRASEAQVCGHFPKTSLDAIETCSRVSGQAPSGSEHPSHFTGGAGFHPSWYICAIW